MDWVALLSVRCGALGGVLYLQRALLYQSELNLHPQLSRERDHSTTRRLSAHVSMKLMTLLTQKDLTGNPTISDRRRGVASERLSAPGGHLLISTGRSYRRLGRHKMKAEDHIGVESGSARPKINVIPQTMGFIEQRPHRPIA